MSAQTLLISLFQYKAWADEGLISGLAKLGGTIPRAEYRTALCVFNHALIVDQIFIANLQRREHSFTRTGDDEAPPLERLSKAVKVTDQWYIEYIARLSADDLAETIRFKFSGGGFGKMSREEMLGHVVTHGGYHRGEVGRIMTQQVDSSPPDTFTGYLHEIEPARRA